MITRKASPQDLDQIMSIYAVARTYMQKNDNPTRVFDTCITEKALKALL